MAPIDTWRPYSSIFEVRKLDGQTVVIDTRNRILYLHLYDGPFLSAGKILGWPNNSIGLGVNMSIIRLAFLKDWRIRIFVGDKLDRCYETHPSVFYEFQQSFNNTYRVGNTELMLLPWTSLYFETIKDFPSEVLSMLTTTRRRT